MVYVLWRPILICICQGSKNGHIIIGVQDYWKRFAGSVLHRRLSWARKAKFSNVAFSNCFGSIGTLLQQPSPIWRSLKKCFFLWNMFSQNAQFLIIVSIEHAFMHQVRSSIRSFPGGNTQHRIRMFSVCMNQFKEHPDGRSSTYWWFSIVKWTHCTMYNCTCMYKPSAVSWKQLTAYSESAARRAACWPLVARPQLLFWRLSSLSCHSCFKLTSKQAHKWLQLLPTSVRLATGFIAIAPLHLFCHSLSFRAKATAFFPQ